MPKSYNKKWEDIAPTTEKCVVRKPPPDVGERVVYVPCAGFRQMFEHYTPNSVGSRRLWKDFQHYKCWISTDASMREATFTVDLMDTLWLHKGTVKSEYPLFSEVEYGGAGQTNSGLSSFYDPVSDTDFIPYPDNLDDLIVSSLKAMLPNVKAELSLLNSLFELKDFKTVGKSLSLYATTLKTMFKGKGTLRQILRGTADGYLQQQFNLLPLLSDISSIHRALSRSEKRMNALVANEGRVRIAHFSRTLDCEASVTSDWVSNSGWRAWLDEVDHLNPSTFPIMTEVQTRRQVIPRASLFHAQMQYNYNYTGYQREHARVLGLLDSLGVNLNPAIIWNAIPWSFVVDWVAGVSRWLNDRKVGWMDPRINILQYLWSYSRERTIQLDARFVSNLQYGYAFPKETSSITRPVVHETSYRRQVGLPSADSFTTSGLNLKEFSLGAALVLSRRKRHKRGKRR